MKRVPFSKSYVFYLVLRGFARENTLFGKVPCTRGTSARLLWVRNVFISVGWDPLSSFLPKKFIHFAPGTNNHNYNFRVFSGEEKWSCDSQSEVCTSEKGILPKLPIYFSKGGEQNTWNLSAKTWNLPLFSEWKPSPLALDFILCSLSHFKEKKTFSWRGIIH